MIDNQEIHVHLEQAKTYLAQVDYPNAERSLLLALEEASKFNQDPHVIVKMLKHLADFYSRKDQYDAAIAQADWAIHIVRNRLGPEHPALEPLYLSMADLQRCDGNQEESQRYEQLAAAFHK